MDELDELPDLGVLTDPDVAETDPVIDLCLRARSTSSAESLGDLPDMDELDELPDLGC